MTAKKEPPVFPIPDIERATEIYWKRFGIGPWHLYTYGKPLVKRMTRHGKLITVGLFIHNQLKS